MKIQSNFTIYNINYKGNPITKKAAGAITAGLAAVGINKLNKNDFCDEQALYDITDIEEVDDNIFDEEYYQAYYNIDLNLAHNRAFRDNELFNPLRDTEDYRYRKYDDDDIKHADNLIYKKNINSYTTEYKLADTDFGDRIMPDAVINPSKFYPDEMKILARYVRFNNLIKAANISEDIKDKILNASKKCTEGFYEVDYDIAEVGINLYTNSNKWSGTEDSILCSIKTNSDKDFYEYRNYINSRISSGRTNEKILRTLGHFIQIKQVNA